LARLEQDEKACRVCFSSYELKVAVFLPGMGQLVVALAAEGFFCAMQVVAFHFAPYGIWRGGRVKFEQFVHMRDV